MLNYAETASTSTIISVVPVPQSRPHELLVEPETISALLTCPDFRYGFEAGKETFEEKAESDDIPHSEEEMIAYVTQQLSVTGHHRANRFSHFLEHPPLSYLYRIGFVVGYLAYLMAKRTPWHAHPLPDMSAEAEEEEAQTATAAQSKQGKSQRSSVPKYPNRLRACIKQKGYTLREVSKETTIPYGTLRHWAAGSQVIPHTERELLAQVIGCSGEDLAPRLAGVPA
jgi:lambda repressor-like predicted transcriptional regulator